MNRHSNFGFSTILLTFVMICILTFSVLALVSANSDYQLSKKTEQNNTAYYAAERDAYRTLAQIDSTLAAAFLQSSDEASYYAAAADRLPGLCDGEVTLDGDDCRITYTVPIQEGQTLRVVLLVCYPKDDSGSFYQILEWKAVHASTYVEDEPYHLIGQSQTDASGQICLCNLKGETQWM